MEFWVNLRWCLVLIVFKLLSGWLRLLMICLSKYIFIGKLVLFICGIICVLGNILEIWLLGIKYKVWLLKLIIFVLIKLFIVLILYWLLIGVLSFFVLSVKLIICVKILVIVGFGVLICFL